MRSTDSRLNRNGLTFSSLTACLLTKAGTSVVILHLAEPRHPKMIELRVCDPRYEVWSLTKRTRFVQGSLVVRKCHRVHKRLQIPQVTSLQLVQLVVRLPKEMSQCVVVSYDKEVRAIFKVTPSMLYRFANG
jgi:hypothetical protein